jgi:branched-chain amino acid transport system permease protein
VPSPTLRLGFTTINFNTDWWLYTFLAFWFFVGIVLALRIVRSPVGAILRAIRDNPLRATAVGHNIHGYKLTAFVVAATYAGFAGGLLGLMQGFMPPDAFMFDTSGQLVMQTAIGGAGTLFGPLVGALILVPLQAATNTWFGGGGSGLTYILYGGIIVLLARFEPGGLTEFWQRIAGRWRARPAA